MNIHAIMLSKWLIVLHSNPESTPKSFSFANKLYSAPLGSWLDLTPISHL